MFGQNESDLLFLKIDPGTMVLGSIFFQIFMGRGFSFRSELDVVKHIFGAHFFLVNEIEE